MILTEILIAIVGFIVILLGVFNIGTSARKNRIIVKLLGELGYRIFNVILGAVFMYLAIFTNTFVN